MRTEPLGGYRNTQERMELLASGSSNELNLQPAGELTSPHPALGKFKLQRSRLGPTVSFFPASPKPSCGAVEVQGTIPREEVGLKP